MDNSGRCFITSEALSAIFMPKIEYRISLLSKGERFLFSDELYQGGLSMPKALQKCRAFCYVLRRTEMPLTAELDDYGDKSPKK